MSMVLHKQLKIKALVLGSLTDIGGTIIIGIIWGVLIGLYYDLQGYPEPENVMQYQGLNILVPGFIIGICLTVLGGYVSGRVAKVQEILHGSIVGCMSLFFGLWYWTSFPFWYNIAGMIVVIPCGMLGGYFATKVCRQK